ncbi:chemotaxis protein CheY [Desulforamulus profundi]|uniref:Stage 0 sporulation protein A homolog n=1 Tax=Desulforamulus profundi TaxID=1383067 RepID=A0A2C6MH21_9FIRM|nr:response regulator [Desulforamulus profundi]PHJ38706.1 chemotaxis protein CheY [Desulforamulus profundi]
MVYRVLIVDDSSFMRNVLKNVISKDSNYVIAGEAKNGLEAIKKYKELNPDIVTMDITMPDMDGLTALKEIRKYDSDARIIICSSMGQKAFVMEAYEAGAKDFIVKPFRPDIVLKVLANALKSP